MPRFAVPGLIVLAALCAVSGCRREDWREFTIEFPVLAEADIPKIAKAVSVYEGVDRSSLEANLEKKTLTLRFDSMKVAQTNIRMAIEKAGVKVVCPPKTGPAGYIDERAPEVPAPSR